MNQYDLIAEQDKQRTQRSFISFLSGAFGVNDQTYAGQDGYAYNQPGQYQTIGVNGSVGIEGQPYSTAQAGAVVMSPLVLIALAVGAYLVLKR